MALTEEAPRPRRTSRRSTTWYRLCLGAIVAFLLLRNGVFLARDIPSGTSELLGHLLALHSMFDLLQVVTVFVLGPLAACVVLVAIVRPRAAFERAGDVWRFRPWLLSFVWLLLLINNFGLDASPRLAAITGATLLLLWPPVLAALDTALETRPRVSRAGAHALVWCVAGALCLLLAADAADRIALGVWLALLVALVELAPRLLCTRDRLAIALLGLGAVQGLSAVLPGFVPLHDGVRFADGPAYTFCESSEHRRLYGAIQTCSFGAHDCSESYVAEHDLDDFTRWRPLRFFDDSFVGRPQQVVCLEETVQVGMNATLVDGELFDENVMEFDIADPTRFRKNLLSGGAGFRIAVDRQHDAIFYVSEWTANIFRRDRRTGELDRDLGIRLVRDRVDIASHIVGAGSFHPPRDALFLGTMQARVMELDLTRLEVRTVFHVPDGMFISVTADPELDRLWIAGLWGLTVVQLPEWKVLERRRLGRFGRFPAIDAQNDVVYIASTYEGKIRAFDRRTLELLGTIPMGFGPRVPFVSQATGRMIASSNAGSYYWPAEELAARLRR